MPLVDIPRISVPSAQAWNSVNGNVTSAINRALDDALPTSADPATRAALLKHLLDWRDRMFKLAAPNLRVNGQNFEDYVETPDRLPFDEALEREVVALQEQSYESDQAIAQRRRNVPKQVRDLLSDLLERQRQAEFPLESAEPLPIDDLGEDYSFMAQQNLIQDQDQDAREAARVLNTRVPHLLERAQWVQEVSEELSSSSKPSKA